MNFKRTSGTDSAQEAVVASLCERKYNNTAGLRDTRRHPQEDGEEDWKASDSVIISTMVT